jgi:hypothetical protein
MSKKEAETDQYFHNLWVVLTGDQKKSLLSTMKSFAERNEMNTSEGNATINEPDAAYAVPMNLFQSLKKKQRKALISFIEASGVESLGGFTIEEYNRDLEEAEREIERGEVVPHEEVMKMLKQRFTRK